MFGLFEMSEIKGIEILIHAAWYHFQRVGKDPDLIASARTILGLLEFEATQHRNNVPLYLGKTKGIICKKDCYVIQFAKLNFERDIQSG